MLFSHQHSDSDELVRKPLRNVIWGDIIRFVLVSIWAVYTVYAHQSEPGCWMPMAFYALLAALILFRNKLPIPGLASASLRAVIDALFISYIVHLFGSITSGIAIYYLVIMIAYHVQEPAVARRTSLIFSILGYGIVLLLEQTGIIPWHSGLHLAASMPPVSDALTAFFKVALALSGAYVFLSISSRKIDAYIHNEKALKEKTRQSQAQTRELQKQIESTRRLESLGRLAGGVAHDFNNLLTGILTYAQFLKEELQDNPSGQHDVDKIIGAARDASSLTSQLLTFGRKQVVRPKILNVNTMVSHARNDIETAIGPRIDLQLKLCSSPGNIRADSSLMKQILLNLAVNAREAMTDGGTLVIQSENLDITEKNAGQFPDLKEGPHVMITMADTGNGIPPEHIEKIFDPFFTTKHDSHSFGLGLSSVYGVVRQANGYIDAQSTPGSGTAIRIVLPRVFESVSGNTAPVSVIPGSRQTILLVEDEEMVRTSVTRILKRQNYNVLAAENGEEAIELFNNATVPINLVLTDVIMTGITGEALADLIHGSHPTMPVLFMSGYTEDAFSRTHQLKESASFLPKPFSADELLLAISKSLRKAGDVSPGGGSDNPE